ncbi:LysR family transcriptional regulator [Streptomyces sp. NPDC059828]|uniref:LysR family transcriptional regulator n=1 Tax=Streptomyces sp. NPDC059828 TaxID=3346965 RepID=UPI0036552BF7
MDLALLRTFVTVHRAGSFTRAATLLGLSQPAVTSQIRTLERQLGRPLFLRQPRGVTPTTMGDELAHRAAPHLDALVEIAEAGLDLDEESGVARTLHLAGPPEFTSLRVLPALTPLIGQGLALRTSFAGNAGETLEGLAAGHHDLAIATARPRGGLLTATPLCDEEHVLVAAPGWAARLAPQLRRGRHSRVLEQLPVVEVHESLPFVTRYWSAVFDSPPAAAATVIAPDLRAVRDSTAAGAGLAVLPRYLCERDLASGRIVALLEPDVPPLRTYFLVVRAGTLALPHIARAHEELLRAAADW